MVHEATSDIGEVLQPRCLERDHKLIHRPDRDLSVGSAVDQELGRNGFVDVAGGRSF